jgi:hypothetical protein
VNGSFEQGSLSLYLENGKGSEVAGDGVILRGPEAAPDILPVVAQGTLAGDELVLQLFDDDFGAREGKLLAGTVGGEGSLSQPGDTPAILPVTLSRASKVEVSPRWVQANQLPEQYIIKFKFQDNDKVVRDCTVEVNLDDLDPSGNYVNGTYTSSVPFGPINGTTTGTVLTQRINGRRAICFELFNASPSRLTGALWFVAPTDPGTRQVNLDDSSKVFISGGTTSRYGVESYIQGQGTVESIL